MTETRQQHTAAFWAAKHRSQEPFIVEKAEDRGDTITLTSNRGWSFNRAKADLGRDIAIGEHLLLETVNLSQITGLRDANGWLFHMTDQDLADEARRFSEELHRKDVIRLEQNRKKWAEQEAALPDWLKARIQRYRDAGGEKFLLEGWGYELFICRLADLMDRGLEAEAEQLARDGGASGNQWDCAKALVAGRAQYGDGFGAALPAGISPITGSADYS